LASMAVSAMMRPCQSIVQRATFSLCMCVLTVRILDIAQIDPRAGNSECDSQDAPEWTEPPPQSQACCTSPLPWTSQTA
jgi:hypothetical protein